MEDPSNGEKNLPDREEGQELTLLHCLMLALGSFAVGLIIFLFCILRH